jgi:adenylyl-sulfate kinase
VWLTGIPGAGKTTIGRAVQQTLAPSRAVFLLDGDELRQRVCADLGYSPADRHENIRRAGAIARLLFDQHAVVLCALVSPYREDRARVRELFPFGKFVEVFVQADVETCRSRDPKGLYRRASEGNLQQLTGLSAPYEEPEAPDLVIDTRKTTVGEAVHMVIDCLETRGILPAAGASRRAAAT